MVAAGLRPGDIVSSHARFAYKAVRLIAMMQILSRLSVAVAARILLHLQKPKTEEDSKNNLFPSLQLQIPDHGHWKKHSHDIQHDCDRSRCDIAL